MHSCRWKILEEILRWDCDVLVLQEVDHHHDFLSPMLAQEGYRSLFVKKPLAPGMAFNPHLEDGCSLFYRATAATTAGDAADSDGDGVTGKRGADTTTKLDLLDAHSFSLAVVEREDDTAGDDNGGDGGGGGGGSEGGGTDKTGGPPAEPVVGNQVALISLLGLSSPGVGGGEGRGEAEEALVIVTTTHLKAKKDGHGELIRSRQVGLGNLSLSRFLVKPLDYNDRPVAPVV